MKKLFIVVGLLAVMLAGGVWYLFSGADEFIRSQIEKQGSAFLGTSVQVASVKLTPQQGQLVISGLEVNNPDGFSDADAISFALVSLDLGGAFSEPYSIQEIRIDKPEILYEVDASGEGNLMVLKRNLQANLPAQDSPVTSDNETMPLITIGNVVIANARLLIDFEKLDTGELKLDKKSYNVTLPTFNAGPLGQPDGLPADKAMAAILDSMLDNIIAQAKSRAKDILAEKAKEKVKEKIDKEKEKLLDKAGSKLKDLLGKD
ncbi:hypothetical protein [Neptunicella sp. SCSIO 80796]|uniref:DUF748 domain-containing protein n=1 Tax=Neptunicella plasticusilytica TaxID=3117012 RepID=UPI003A4D8097